MSARDLSVAVVNAGLVTSVGLTAASACAAMRAGLTNHTPTRFVALDGEWILGAQVELEMPWRGREKLIEMLRLAVEDCLEGQGPADSEPLPLLLCVAETQRAGRLGGLDDQLIVDLGTRLGIPFDRDRSRVMAYGRVGAAVALSHARRILQDARVSRVLIAGTDSLMTGPTLSALESQGRLLTAKNSNGLLPGEAAGAVLMAREGSAHPQLVCLGLGFSEEQATVTSSDPLRGLGLATAIRKSLGEAGCQMHDLDFRITDLSGEQYYFKEAALALSRTLRQRKPEFDLWHPADSIGETGAAVGAVSLAVALMSGRKAYAPGPNVILHFANDGGERAAAVMQFRGPAQ